MRLAPVRRPRRPRFLAVRTAAADASKGRSTGSSGDSSSSDDGSSRAHNSPDYNPASQGNYEGIVRGMVLAGKPQLLSFDEKDLPVEQRMSRLEEELAWKIQENHLPFLPQINRPILLSVAAVMGPHVDPLTIATAALTYVEQLYRNESSDRFTHQTSQRLADQEMEERKLLEDIHERLANLTDWQRVLQAESQEAGPDAAAAQSLQEQVIKCEYTITQLLAAKGRSFSQAARVAAAAAAAAEAAEAAMAAAAEAAAIKGAEGGQQDGEGAEGAGGEGWQGQEGERI